MNEHQSNPLAAVIYSFLRGSICVCCQEMQLYGGISCFFSLPQLGPKSYGYSLLLLSLTQCLNHNFWNSQIHPTQGDNKRLNLLPQCFCLLKSGCCSDSQSYMCHLFTRQYKGQRHCSRQGIKVFQNPQIPTKTCNDFMFLGVGQAFTISITALVTTCISPDKMTPQNLQRCFGLEFSMGLLPIFSLANVPATSAQCSAAGASFHMLTLHHQRYGPVFTNVGRRIGTGLWLSAYNISQGNASSFGEGFEMFIIVPPT